MAKKKPLNARLTLSLAACGIVFDFIIAITPDSNMKFMKHSPEFKRALSLYIALLFSGIDQGKEVPNYYNGQHDTESLFAMTFGKKCSREDVVAFYRQIQENNRRDIRNCICHGLFDFAKTKSPEGKLVSGIALRPNRSRNKALSPLFIAEDDIEEFVEQQIKQKTCVLSNTSTEDYRNACISKLALMAAKQYKKGDKIVITSEMDELLDKYGMEFFSSVIGSILFVYNQNTLYPDFKNQEDSKEVFCTVRNAICHGNFKTENLKVAFQDPKNGITYHLNVWQMLQAVAYYLSASKKGKVFPDGLAVEDFVKMMYQSRVTEDDEQQEIQ